MNIRRLIGLAGVAKNENFLAQEWGKRFEFAMVLIAIWLPLQWYMQRHHEIIPILAEISNWLIWGLFVTETVTLLYLVDDRKNYLSRNWMNGVIITLGLPLIWEQTPLLGILRGMQLLIMLRLLFPWWDTTVHFLSRNKLGTTLTAAFVSTILAGVLMSIIDPAFKSPWVGIWWAWQTITTVGYGDIIPESFLGRCLACIVMVMGLALLSLITANFAAYFISKGTTQVAKTEDHILKTLQEIQKRLDKIEKELKK